MSAMEDAVWDIWWMMEVWREDPRQGVVVEVNKDSSDGETEAARVYVAATWREDGPVEEAME